MILQGWEAFKDVIFEFLRVIQSFVGDWGMAIIVLTVLVRLLLMPLTIKQTKSMYELQRIQPKIKELQKKYANDKEKLQEETLKFYQENKVNPLAGCLPMLLQMPLLFALYGVLGPGTKASPGNLIKYLAEQDMIGRFYFLIPDISRTPGQVFSQDGLLPAVPYILLVVLFGLSVWLPQALMPGDKQQKMIGGYMAVLMLFFGWSAPAGVLLYWDLSSVWGIGQQQATMALMKRRSSEAEGEEEKAKDAKISDERSPKSQASSKGPKSSKSQKSSKKKA